MLVLDQALSASLLTVAASEKLVTHAIDEKALYLDPTTSNFLSKGTGEKLRQQVLWDLLLHYPAVLSPVDNMNFTGLQKIGLVSEQLDADSQSLAYTQLSNSPEIVRSIQEFILADLGEAHATLLTDGAVQTFLRLHASDGFRIANRMDSAMFDMFDTFEEYVAGTKAMFGDTIYRTPGRGGREVSGRELGEEMAAAADRNDFAAFKSYQPFIDFMHDFGRSAQRWLALTNLSRAKGAVLSANIPNSLLKPTLASQTGGFQSQIRTGVNQGSTHAAVRIWLEEVRCVPRLRTVEDVLRLREDKRIDAFREAMMEWTQSLASGSPSEEARLRKLVGTANNELGKLSGIERMTKYWTFASVPLDVLLMLYPPTSLPVPVTSLIGLSVMAATKSRTKPLDWVMFGGV